MFAKSTVAITSLLAVAQALKVTSPAKDAEWDASKSNEITWDSVDTDPKSFDIVIINQSSYPEFSEKIATVNTADGKYDLKDAKVAAGDNYRINFVSNDPENSGILAQSQEFDFTAGSSNDKTTSAAASSTGSPSSSASSETATSAASASATASGMTTMTSATATGSAAASETSGASETKGASGTASGTAAKPTTTAPSSASALKSTFAIMGSVAVAAYMLF